MKIVRGHKHFLRPEQFDGFKYKVKDRIWKLLRKIRFGSY
jgi:hypothetical protein